MDADERFCKVCAARIEVGDGYCPSCGGRIVWVAPDGVIGRAIDPNRAMTYAEWEAERMASEAAGGTPVTVEYLESRRKAEERAALPGLIAKSLFSLAIALIIFAWLLF